MQFESKIQLRDRNREGLIIRKARALCKVNKIDILSGGLGYIIPDRLSYTKKTKWKLGWQCKKSNDFATVTKKYKIIISC